MNDESLTEFEAKESIKVVEYLRHSLQTHKGDDLNSAVKAQWVMSFNEMIKELKMMDYIVVEDVKEKPSRKRKGGGLTLDALRGENG